MTISVLLLSACQQDTPIKKSSKVNATIDKVETAVASIDTDANEKSGEELLEIFVSPENIEKENNEEAEAKTADEIKKEKAIASIEKKKKQVKKATKKEDNSTSDRLAKPVRSAEPVAAADSNEEPPLKKTKIRFDKSTHDYGMIMQGDKVDHRFNFTNVGNEDLVIKDVSASCGCTKPSYPFIPIRPGEKGYIGVNFDSKGKLGKQKPTVTVISNAGTNKLHLDGFVDAERANANTNEQKEPTAVDIIDEDEMKKLKEEAENSGNGIIEGEN